MAKKDKKYILQDEEELGEVEKHTVSTYGPDDKADDKTKAIKGADEEDVTFNDDGTFSVREDENIEEVEQSRVMQFDLKKSEDIKTLQRMLEKGIDSRKMTVGTDGTIQVTEQSEKVEGQVISVSEFKRMVENNNKVDLSEQEIMSILFETENPRMTKSELIEEISNNIIYEADMNDDVRRKFESGESDYSEHLDPDSIRNISQQVFTDIQNAIREKTGRRNVNMDDVQHLLGNSLLGAIQKEQRIGIPRLEQKAVQMIREQFNIPEDAVDFQAEITGLPQLGGRPIVRGNMQYNKGNKRPPRGKSEEELKPEVTRRRLTNAMMHGAARKSQNLHHLSDEVRDMDPSLNQDYSRIMAANDAMYWMMSDEQIESEGRNGVHAGNVRLDLSNPEKPKIIAQGIVFPILLHELAKGVMELMSLWSLPEDKDVRDYVTDKTDHLEAETNDIRLGPHIWGKFVEQIPVDNHDVISLTFNLLQQLPTEEFNDIISGLANDQEQAKSRVRQLADEAISQLNDEEYEDSVAQYRDEPEEAGEDDDVDTMLGGEPEVSDEPEEVDFSTWSQRDLQRALDDALDNNNLDLAREIGQYIK